MEKKITGDEPVTPSIFRRISDNEVRLATQKEMNEGKYLVYFKGLTKREYFSGLAMQGMLAQSNGNSWDFDLQALGEKSVNCADALINALNS